MQQLTVIRFLRLVAYIAFQHAAGRRVGFYATHRSQQTNAVLFVQRLRLRGTGPEQDNQDADSSCCGAHGYFSLMHAPILVGSDTGSEASTPCASSNIRFIVNVS